MLLGPFVAVALDFPGVSDLVDVFIDKRRYPDVEVIVVGSYNNGPAGICFLQMIDKIAVFNPEGARLEQAEFGGICILNGNVCGIESCNAIDSS